MDIVKYIAAIAAAAPLVCSAASQNNAEQVSCSGTQTTDTTNGLQIDCVGSLTIVGGSLTSDTFIKLTASDALFLDNISVKAPIVNLDGATISVSSTAKIDSAKTMITSVSGATSNPVRPSGTLIDSGSNNKLPNPSVIQGGNVQNKPSAGGDLNWTTFPINSTNRVGYYQPTAGVDISFRNGSALSNNSNSAGNINGSISTGAGGVITGNGSGSIRLANSGATAGLWLFNPNGLSMISNGGGNTQPTAPVCTPSGASSIFKTLESGTRFCAGSKKKFNRIQFLRATTECRIPNSFEIAATQDFPLDTTQTKVAECNDIGGGNVSCALHDATNSSGNAAQAYAGRLALKWGWDSDIHGLTGRIIEKTADGCHSESTLKLVKQIH